MPPMRVIGTGAQPADPTRQPVHPHEVGHALCRKRGRQLETNRRRALERRGQPIHWGGTLTQGPTQGHRFMPAILWVPSTPSYRSRKPPLAACCSPSDQESAMAAEDQSNRGQVSDKIFYPLCSCPKASDTHSRQSLLHCLPYPEQMWADSPV